VARRIGRFEEANGGSLLLDEISEMDPRLQAKLLRAVQEREIDRVGGSSPVKVDVRILATSNRDLEEEVARGRFRGDLYYRLNVVSLQIPALAQRPKDIAVLARHFADKYARANGLDHKEISPDALRKLLGHPWPGNVRELENTIHRAVLIATGERIEADAILLSGSPTTRATGAGAKAATVGRTVADVERDLIIDTLRHCFGNRTHAANILGISIRTLRNKLRQYIDEGIAIPRPGESPACGHPAL
jgi:DNA-binding NtrC family response regulator